MHGKLAMQIDPFMQLEENRFYNGKNCYSEGREAKNWFLLILVSEGIRFFAEV